MSKLPTHTPLLSPVWLVLIALLTSACTRCGSSQKNLHVAAEPGAPPAEQCIESVVTGDGTICVLRTDGSVLCFGRIKDFTDAGPSGKVMDVPALRSISEDGHGFCGVTRTGEVVTWAANEERAKVLDVFGTDNLTVVSVTGGYCVLKESHEVRCQSRYNPVPPDEAPVRFTKTTHFLGRIAITNRGVGAVRSAASSLWNRWRASAGAVALGRGSSLAEAEGMIKPPVPAGREKDCHDQYVREFVDPHG